MAPPDIVFDEAVSSRRLYSQSTTEILKGGLTGIVEVDVAGARTVTLRTVSGNSLL